MEAYLIAKNCEIAHSNFLNTISLYGTYSAGALIFGNLPKLLQQGIVIVAILLINFLLPIKAHVLLEVGLHSPIGPHILPWMLAVLFQQLSSMKSACATLRLPVSSAAGPVSIPQLLIRINTRDTLRYISARVPKIPLP